ncbi:MAG: hypothetical protein M0Z44_05085 [Gammaproteobacteria bacterium]|nr:hypothetical protein [Gammaproteobacteria bacterium]
MHIKREDTDSVTLELTATEAGHIAADLTENTAVAGSEGQTLAKLLKDQGYFLALSSSPRTEWIGPDD